MESPLPRLLFDSSETCADLLYLSGFRAGDPFLWLQRPGERPLLVVSELEIGRAQKQAHQNQDILSFGDFRELTGFSRDDLKVKESRLVVAYALAHDCKTWSVPGYFPLRFARKLVEGGLQLVVGEDDFCPERACKSPQEIEAVRKALRITEAGLARGIEILKQSEIGADGLLHWQGDILRAETLRGEIDCEITRRGGRAKDTITAPGRQAADPHQSGYGPIPANEPIVIDIFPRDTATGYHGDLTRTVVRGQASEQVRKAYATVKAAQAKAFSLLKPGALGHEVHEAVVQYFRDCGYETCMTGVPYGYFHGTGHGLGLEIHESPSLSTRIETPLVPGNVVTVEPGLYYPEWGGVRLEDVAALTAEGVEDLTLAPFELEI
jgi:Xaa-Pro aminopeptidase